MALAIFDLDETLIAADSAAQWARWMSETGLTDDPDFIAKDDQRMTLYNAGQLDMAEYMQFSLQPLIGRSAAEIDALVPPFVEQRILPRVYPQGLALLRELQQAGHRLLIISATAEFLVRPIAARLGVSDVLGIQLAFDEQGRHTGHTDGVLSFREGKVTRLQAWLAQTGETLDGASFYSDSINDLPLLEYIGRPMVTNPSPALQQIARERGWPIIDWRKEQSPAERAVTA
ncbi:HAD family hydrolase [Marinobacterium arenosum]|uniref:HAD family hydrolase n=1 Tax=Marinobacterium arenosum TaxID=2862496 RepID=UPI001C9723AA|nr:HAD family hydrolase [Marinobacterium arenosum]MBY4677488.1 HAD-IB family hydrolase [Marinobacterium arenosum]